MNTIRWLHLSDFHTGKDDYGQLRLFDSILKHIDGRIAQHGKPDLVFITGDIAQSARAEQYDTFAEEFLLALADKVGEKRILMVPGNHDVDQKKQKLITREAIRAKSPEFFDPTSPGLAEREHLLPRFEAYRKHCHLLLAGAGDDWLASEAGCLLRTFDINDLSLGILGLDTAWLSEGKSDERELTPGKPLVEAGLAEIADAKIKIVLGHHPLDWFHPEDRKPMEALFGQHQVLYLHGHMHQNDAGFVHGAGNLFLTLQSGAGFQVREDEKWVNRLLWAELDPENQQLMVEPYQWSKRHQEWKLDFEAFSEQYRQADRWRLDLPGTQLSQPSKSTSPAAPPPKKFKPGPGWELLDRQELEKRDTAPEAEDILAYFDGRQPTFRLALCPQVPRRAVVARLAGRILAASGNGHPTVNLLLGAGGEGKSTAFLQTMEKVVRAEGDWRVLHRRHENAELSRKWVDELPQDDARHWLIASDDADQIAEEVYNMAFALQSRGRGDVHFLLCARHTEWRGTKVEQRRWESLLGSNYREENLRGLDEEDARAIVDAWGAYQERGMRELAGKSQEEAVQALLAASRSETSQEEGAFLGALLRLRMGDQMKAYVRRLLDRLGEKKILPGKSETLLDAFAYITAMHAENQLFLSKPVLANTLAINGRQLNKVLWDLGKEAAADVSGEMVFTRHRAIAETALEILKENNPYAVEPEELYEDLVTTAEELKQKGHFLIALEKWRFLSDHFFEKGEAALAIRLAQALVRTDATNSYFRVKLSQLCRNAGQPGLALKAFREAPRPDDLRGFFHEWATAEGEQGNHALTVWLDAVSLADDTARRRPDNRQTPLSLAGFGVACRELFRNYNTRIFMEACGAASDLGLALPYLDAKAKRFLSEHQAAARAEGVEEFAPANALKCIQEAAIAAHNQRESDLQDWVQSAEDLTFLGLESLFGLAEGKGNP
uniref:Calcineurin-like phosphoesterase n=1 Tax=Candidatus Kentrum sp. FW TaxID=2126338 RepID=A0A450TPR8_9GAMM|nr:MAG: Calcineurin-like phosphoesterase [Candidatus Kentron sp. FW]